jgi:hypothetical protein
VLLFKRSLVAKFGNRFIVPGGVSSQGAAGMRGGSGPVRARRRLAGSVVDIADYLCRTVDEVQAKIDEVEAKIVSRN